MSSQFYSEWRAILELRLSASRRSKRDLCDEAARSSCLRMNDRFAPAGSTGQRNTPVFYQGWSLDMKQRRRIYYSAAQRSEIWDRWQAGEPMSAIGRRFDRESSSVFSVISPTGGIRPPDRRRSKQTLSLSEREEISRWLSMRRSLRSIATHLGRSASTISR